MSQSRPTTKPLGCFVIVHLTLLLQKRLARRWPRRISPRPLRARANDCFDGPGPVLRSNGTRRRNKTQSPKRASRRGTEVHVRCSSPRRTARGQYDAGAIRHSVGGNVAGDTRLWKCCNPDTSGGNRRWLSRDRDRTFCQLLGTTYSRTVRSAPQSTRRTKPHESPGRMLGLSSRDHSNASSSGFQHSADARPADADRLGNFGGARGLRPSSRAA